MAAISLGACFSEDPPHCPRGDRGCRCLEGLCEDGFVCSERDYCLLEDCTPGEVYCSCDAGMCNGVIECFDDAVCRPEEPIDVAGTEGSASGSGSGSTSTSDSTSTTTTDAQTSTSTPTDCTPGEPCGPCRRCDDEGDCEVEVGVACDGPTLQCADYVWGYEAGTCYLKAAAELGARCDVFGECREADVSDCPDEIGEPGVVCEPGCVDAPALCVPNAPAATVTVESMCIESGPGPDCGPTCFNGSYSQVSHYECSGGQCVNVPALDVDCGPYRCENLACNTTCVDVLDCVMLHACDPKTGTCYVP